MIESEQNLVEAMNKPSAKIDSYDKLITTLGSDISMVQSQVDLSMCSIQTSERIGTTSPEHEISGDFWQIRE
jgi:hypothetical protein